MLTLIIPAFNEAEAVGSVVRGGRQALEGAGIVHEIIVVDDGSTDGTGEAAAAAGARVITHPANGGYGRSLKHGIMESQYDLIAICDADGTYPVEALPGMVRRLGGFDMVVGARVGGVRFDSFVKSGSRVLFRWLCEFTTGTRIPDPNSGLRVFRKAAALRFFDEISHGYSFTTTLTLGMILHGYFVRWEPIEYHARVGESKVRHLRDALRTGQLIIQAILYQNPIKLFLLLALPLGAACAGAGAGAVILRSQFWAGWSIVLGLSACLVFCLGLLAELLRHLLLKPALASRDRAGS